MKLSRFISPLVTLYTKMKNVYTIFGIIIFVLLAVIGLQSLRGSTTPAIAAKITDPDAKALVEQADRSSREWQTLNAEAAPLREKLASLESEQAKLAGGNAGRLYTLCSQYGILYVRGENGAQGTIKDATPADCAPLQ